METKKIRLAGGSWYTIFDNVVTMTSTEKSCEPVSCEQVQKYVDRGFDPVHAMAACLKSKDATMNEDQQMMGN